MADDASDSLNRRSYGLVTGSYWGLTLTDGALRMLVLLHFHDLGFSPIHLAFLFLLYEFCGILTNLLGGWIGSRIGLRFTLFVGLATQIIALVMLSYVQDHWVTWISVSYVMSSQALSGIAKDLTKMSSKSAVKLLAKGDSESETQGVLFRWVAILTGSKNTLKGIGFFMGGMLLTQLGFVYALRCMAAMLVLVLFIIFIALKQDMGRSKAKVKFKNLFSKSREINVLSAARFFLFASRDVWFVVGLPVFLAEELGWSFSRVGAFMAAWVIGYGLVQAGTPWLIKRKDNQISGARAAQGWGTGLTVVSGFIAFAIAQDFHPTFSILFGLALFGVIFAVNSSVHSFLILAYTDPDKVALNVGFYYMANACGRFVGTLLSGVMYMLTGLSGCLWTSTALLLASTILTFGLPESYVESRP